MAYSNNKITAPVSIYDVQRALGNASPDLGTLCKATNINKWARYKPIRTTTPIVGALTFSTRKARQFGLEVPYCDNGVLNDKVYKLVYQEGYESEGWNYLQPRGDRTAQGGTKEFYRLTDFARNPDETTPSSSGDPTAATLQGYNHKAPLPFTAVLNVEGMTEMSDATGKYYEINTQVMSQLTVELVNDGGDDLHLQDFIDLSENSGSTRWRPVLQVFNNYKPAGGTDWWQRTSPDFEKSGTAITSTASASVSVAIDLTDSYFTPYIGNGYMFHLCIGVGLCDTASPIAYSKLFILPYTDQQYDDYMLPFYYRFTLVSHAARTLKATAMQFFDGGYARWTAATGTAPYFQVTSNATGALRLTLTISKNSQAADFVGEHGTAQSGYTALKLQVRERITGQATETIYYLSPATSSWYAANDILIPAGSTSETVTLYAMLTAADIPTDSTASYYIYINSGGIDWSNIGYFSIHKNRN